MLLLNVLHSAKSLPLSSQCICVILLSVADSKSQVKAALDPTAVVTSWACLKTFGLGKTTMTAMKN